MRKVIVKEGTQISTLWGYLIVKEINDGGLVYCDEYTADEDDPDTFSKEETRLTAAEIASRMKEVDGLNHKVILERGTDE